MDLIIVESPTKARTLSRFLGDSFVVDFTMGHVRDLPKSKLGIDTEKGFEPQYVAVAKKKDVLDRLKKEAGQVDKVYLATDPDREGEAIAFHVHETLNSNSNSQKAKFARIVFHEITESAVKEAIGHPKEINMPLVHAQQARRVLDRLVGYKLSPLLWKKVRRGLSAGRVQSVAVRLIVEREREVQAFHPEEYWEVYVVLSTQKTVHRELIVRLVKIGDKKAEIKNSEQARAIAADLEKAVYSVASVEKREVHKRPSPPFTTSTLTQAAARTYYWSAKKTMSIAQKLYEEGLITYHRTDSTNLAIQAVLASRDFIGRKFGQAFVPEKPRFYKTTSKVAQEAHEAIRPTDVNFKFQISNFKLGRETDLLYGLIWRRFIACQMSDSVFDETLIEVFAGSRGNRGSKDYMLRAAGQIMKFEGWKAVYKKSPDTGETTIHLPEVVQDESLQLNKVSPIQKYTEPPSRYTEASLVKTLEKLGIGRPSTYAPTISTIQDRQYVEKAEGKFIPTSLGIAVNDFLVKNFGNIIEYGFTAKMEEDLDEIANARKQWMPVIRDFWQPFSERLSGVEENSERVKVEVKTTGNKCPVCQEGGEVIRVGRFGKFLSCSRFPECKYTAPYIEKLDMKCPECGEGDVAIKKTRRGKRFYGCGRYPECKWASWRKPDIPVVKTSQEQQLDTNTVQ